MKTNMIYFSYDPNGNGFTLHKTAAEAKKLVADALEDERDQARNYGWTDYVEHICWGELRQHAVETVRSSTESMAVDYGLVDVCAQHDLLSAIENLVNSLVDADEEGLIEHVEAIADARAAIANAHGE